MNVRRMEGIEPASGLATFNKYGRARPSTLTNSSGRSSEFESYVAAMCGLALMLTLVVGAVEYSGISRAFRAAARATSGAHLASGGPERMRGKPAHLSGRFSPHTPATE